MHVAVGKSRSPLRSGEWWDEAIGSDLVCSLNVDWKCLLTAHCIAAVRTRGKLLGIAVSETRSGVEDVWWSKNEVIS
ncbi:hypothetical protein E2C01_056008 [Portunus trituberculatus]|uniref:Uncharacterized protein n=1 Tax=Portunus trituberculatus TaxID=210409 RepID=A0A5B7GP75_PORTR|nr:hypothetical protein [Portunus trituberculatus]